MDENLRNLKEKICLKDQNVDFFLKLNKLKEENLENLKQTFKEKKNCKEISR